MHRKSKTPTPLQIKAFHQVLEHLILQPPMRAEEEAQLIERLRQLPLGVGITVIRITPHPTTLTSTSQS